MNKKKKKTLAIIIIIILVAVILALCYVNMDNRGSNNDSEVLTFSDSDDGNADMEEDKDGEESSDNEENGENADGSDATDEAEDEETNYWENVEVYEDGDSQETMTDENGEYVTESYAGEADGWSPIVSPDDLE